MDNEIRGFDLKFIQKPKDYNPEVKVTTAYPNGFVKTPETVVVKSENLNRVIHEL